jgi:DUF4097 and DUF4098 domain-containing protein YvlB
MAAAAAQATTTVHETRPLDADGRVEIENMVGSIEVIGWERTEVEISGTLDDRVKDLDISAGGSRLRISVEQRRGTRYSPAAYLTIKVPSGASLEIETVASDISVGGVSGDLVLESVSGQVEVSGEPRSLDAASVSGDVRVAATSGDAKLESVSGDVIVERAAGRLETDVVSGTIRVESGRLDGFDAETVSGSIFCSAQPTDGARFSIEAMSGTIELRVAADINADFQIETYSGAIDNAIGPPATRSSDYGPGRELRFRAGSGGGRISIESFSGDIRLRTE